MNRYSRLKQTGFKDKPRKPLQRRAKLRVQGHSDTADLKQEIQDTSRAIVILRDGGCILRDARHCNGLPGVPGVVLQADHLVTRSNSGDLRRYSPHRLRLQGLPRLEIARRQSAQGPVRRAGKDAHAARSRAALGSRRSG